MKIKNKSKKRKYIIIMVIALCLLATSVIVYFLFLRSESNNDTNTKLDDVQNKELVESTEAESKKKALNDQKNAGDNPTESPPLPSESDISLSARQEPNGSVTVFTKLQTLPSGLCTLTVSNGSSQTSQTADVIYQPDYSSCAGFTVQRAELGAGEWQINLMVSYGSQKYNKKTSLTVE